MHDFSPKITPENEKEFEVHQSRINEDVPFDEPGFHQQKSQKEKEKVLDEYLMKKAHQSESQFEKFNNLIKDICERNGGYRIQTGVKIKEESQVEAVTCIKDGRLSQPV